LRISYRGASWLHSQADPAGRHLHGGIRKRAAGSRHGMSDSIPRGTKIALQDCPRKSGFFRAPF
jgi:hypothetical protein